MSGITVGGYHGYHGIIKSGTRAYLKINGSGVDW